MLKIERLHLFYLNLAFVFATNTTATPSDTDQVTLWQTLQTYWFYGLALNLLGYGSILLPGYLIIKYLNDIDYLETGNQSTFYYDLVVRCVFGRQTLPTTEDKSVPSEAQDQNSEEKESFLKKSLRLIFCAVGLNVSFICWGLVQERIMKKPYGEAENEEKFSDSQFLVFSNKIMALIVAFTYTRIFKQPQNNVPIYKYSFCSFSNVLSSFCQYEALKYLTYPTMVMAKACKVIPVMIMGIIVSRTKYGKSEWFTAAFISAGLAVFLYGSGKTTSKVKADHNSLEGFFLMILYFVFDSFTSNWQSKLFKQYKMNSIQMMLGLNLFSVCLTVTSLLQKGDFMSSFGFMTRHSEIIFHVLALSVCSAVGQLFIFYTIEQFGPVIFTIIMILRQGLTIMFSCIVHGNQFTLYMGVGMAIIFTALGFRVYNNWKRKQKRNKQMKATEKVTSDLQEEETENLKVKVAQ